MAKKKTVSPVRDIIDGQPTIILANGHFYTFDKKRGKYIDTGVKATADDDPYAVKFFKLTNTSAIPTAPQKIAGWATPQDLNTELKQAGWSENPLTTSPGNRYCYMAVYGKSNVKDDAATTASGSSVIFKEKFTFSTVALWSNYANSPTIEVSNGRIIITNPDGTRITQEFATVESSEALLKLIQGLQKQVDKAVYAYQGKGAPAMSGSPTASWLFDAEGKPITNPATIADTYAAHVGDTYTDIDTYVSYSFNLKPGASASDPASYEWAAIQNTALTKALADIAKMGKEKVSIFTEKPLNGYRKGDLWMDADGTSKVALRDNTAFADADWINPYVNVKDFEAFKKEYQALAAQFATAQGNIADLINAMSNFSGTIGEAFKDNIISEAEKRDMKQQSNALDIEQAQLQSNVNCILDNQFLEQTLKTELDTRSKKLLAPATGSVDKLQESIAAAIADNRITDQERADYTAKYNAYVADAKSLADCIAKCRKAIDEKSSEGIAAAKAVKMPEINPATGNWKLWDDAQGQLVDTSFSSKGDDGNPPYLSVKTKTWWEYDPSRPEAQVPGEKKGYRDTGVKADGVAVRPNLLSYSYVAAKRALFKPNTATGAYVESYPGKNISRIAASGSATDDYTASRNLFSYIYGDLNKFRGVRIYTVRARKLSGVITVLSIGTDIAFAKVAINQELTTEWAEYSLVLKRPLGTEPNMGVGLSLLMRSSSEIEIEWTKVEEILPGEPEIPTMYIPHVDDLKGASGKSALNCALTVQGEFKTRYEIVGDQGQILSEPRAVRYIEGGVKAGGVDYVQAKAVITYGLTDVTAKALANGAAATWKVNGLQVASNTDTLNLGVQYADGVSDTIEFEFDDTNVENWL